MGSPFSALVASGAPEALESRAFGRRVTALQYEFVHQYCRVAQMGLRWLDEDRIRVDWPSDYWLRPDLFLYSRGVPVLANSKRRRSQSDAGNSRTVQKDPRDIEAVYDAFHYSNGSKKVNDVFLTG